MFQVIFWTSLIIVLGGIAWHYLAHPLKGGLEHRTVFPAQTRPCWCFWDKQLTLLGNLKRLACLLALASLALMALTGFIPRLVLGQPMSGYPLMLHVGLAPVFIGCVAFAVLTWAYQWRLDKQDWQGICRLCRCQFNAALDHSNLGCKLSFWLAAILAIPASLSMVLSMFPLFDSHGLETLFLVHQYAGLTMTLLAIIHLYFLLRIKSKPEN